MSIHSLAQGKVLTRAMKKKIRKRLLLYLVVFFLCSVWGLINRIWQISIAIHRPPAYMTGLEAFFSPLQGFLNALVYGLNNQVLTVGAVARMAGELICVRVCFAAPAA